MASFISHLHAAIFLLFCLTSAAHSATFSPARPPSIPLAVRSPYLSTWLQAGKQGGNGGYLAGEWPTFWNGAITGWAGMIRVDGKVYTFMGLPEGPQTVSQTAFKYTSTRSIFTQRVDNAVELTITFFSPVAPKNLVVGSLGSSYMTVDVRSMDGEKHDIQLYTDISAEWVSGDRSSQVVWDYGVTQAKASPKAKRDTGAVLAERVDSLHKRLHRRATDTPSVLDENAVIGTPSVVHPFSVDVPDRDTLVQTYPTATASSGDSVDSIGVTNTVTASEDAATVTGSKNITVTLMRVPTAARGQNKAAASGIAYHHISRKQQLQFAEFNDQTEYGQWYYMTRSSDKLTHQSGADTIVRNRFIASGNLANTEDTKFRAINDRYPVFAYAVNLGTVGSSTVSTTFTIALNQRYAIKFQGAQDVHSVPALWTSYFGNDLAANSWFYKQHDNILAAAVKLDDKIHADSVKAGGENYATITSLSVRQAFGALQLAGTPELVKYFLKEISSDGNVQTVDVIFPFHPILLYLNPTLLKYMLDPLLINQEAGHWPYKFSIHDLGSRYPNATGHSDGNAEQQPLEECGDMLIMALAYAQRANDNSWLKKHYTIFKKWNSFLVDEALIPANQLSTDDFAGPIANSTNAALKGIIGIQAMSRIAKRTGNTKDANEFESIAKKYIAKWQGYGVSNTPQKHTTLNYGFPKTWSLLYNLFADKLLSLDLVPQSIYDMQSSWYARVAATYGVPLDNRHLYTKVDWEMFCAAVAGSSTKKLFIDRIAKWVHETPTSRPFTDLYNVSSGGFPDGLAFQNRPVVGGEFALLALNSAP